MSFKTYATLLIGATALLIPASLALTGGWDFVPSPLVAAGDFALALLVRGYCLGSLPGYSFDPGHWTLRA